jgi:hypothetical protein
MKPELQLLIKCCKTTLSKNDITFIRSQLTVNNLPRLTTARQLAYVHGVFPLFCQSVENYASDLIPKEIMSELKQEYLLIARRNMLMSAELLRIMKLLADNSIVALAFKGPALAQLVYGDITLRQYADLDILVKKTDVYRVDSLLKARGYKRSLKLTPSQEELWISCAHDLGLYHPDNGVHLEMHWSLMNENHPVQLELSAIWCNPETVTINQQGINTFSREDLLVYLCVHGSKHLWERIEWIKDIHLLSQSPELDWNKVLRTVDGKDFEVMFYLGLQLADLLFAADFPVIIKKRLDSNKKLPALAGVILQEWQEQDSSGLIKELRKTRIRLKLIPGVKKQLLYLYQIILKPSFNEYWLIDLPKSFYWLYFFIRPCLLLRKYFKSWWRAQRR